MYNDQGVEIQTKTYHKLEPSEIMFSEQKLGDKGELLADYNELGREINSYEYVSGTGNISTIKDGTGNVTAYGYDTKNGTLLQMSSNVNGISNTNTYGYTLNFLTKISHNNFNITYDYDNQGRVTKIKVTDADYLTFVYSQNGLNSQSTITYSNNQSFRTVTDKNGNVIEVYYKESLAATEIPILENIYDTHGNLIAVNDKVTNTTTEYTLDKFGNIMLQEDTQHNLAVKKQNSFDAENNNTATKYTIGTNTQNYLYSYNTTKPESVLNSVTLPTNAVQSVLNDNLGRTKEIALTSADKAEKRLFHYLKSGLHTSNQVSSIWYGDKDKYVDNLKYKYDEKGNITEVYENGVLSVRYKYDGLSRLIREDNKALNKTTVWEYDAGGNITNRLEYTFSLSDLTTLSPTVVSYSYASNGNRDRLMSYDNKTITYDAIGNPTNYLGNTLVWEKGRQLKSYGSNSYEYNAQGIRTKKTTANTTTQYFLDGTKILAQKDTINADVALAENFMEFLYGIDGVIGFKLFC